MTVILYCLVLFFAVTLGAEIQATWPTFKPVDNWDLFTSACGVVGLSMLLFTGRWGGTS